MEVPPELAVGSVAPGHQLLRQLGRFAEAIAQLADDAELLSGYLGDFATKLRLAGEDHLGNEALHIGADLAIVAQSIRSSRSGLHPRATPTSTAPTPATSREPPASSSGDEPVGGQGA